MAKKKVNTARDFMVKKIRIGDGFEIETKLRVLGLEYLEDIYDKPVSKITFSSGRVKDFRHLLTALAISTYPDMAVDEIKRKISHLEFVELYNLLDEIGDLFQVQAKNLKRPSKRTEVTGNLTEKS